jgi:phospholipid transport system substrate-binding protein
MTNHYFPERGRSLLCTIVYSIGVVLLIVSCIVAADDRVDDSDSSSSPSVVVTRLHTGLIDASRRLEAGTVEERYTAIEPLITDTHDLPYIARFALRRHWSDLSEDQQSQFIDVFSRLSVATYANRFAGVTDETFGISAQRETPRGHVEVIGTLMQSDDVTFDAIYVLHQNPDNWRIINILVDGVSDLALKRSEYQRIYAEVSFAGLIDFLSSQTVDLMQPAEARTD